MPASAPPRRRPKPARGCAEQAASRMAGGCRFRPGPDDPHHLVLRPDGPEGIQGEHPVHAEEGNAQARGHRPPSPTLEWPASP